MCGILFLYDKLGISEEKKSNFEKALESKGMRRRGPDSKDLMQFSDNVLIGHTRLSILDLTNKSNQPLESFNKRFIISFNGEIFNYKELQKYLKFSRNKISSFGDTRTLLELIALKGLVFTLDKIDGDFAFVLIDKKLSKVYIARDRFGAKPIYYYQDHDKICFSSRIDAIHIAINKQFTPDYESIAEYFHHGVGGESKYTWFSNIKRISPGSYSEFKINNLSKLKERVYFTTRNLKNKKFKSPIVEIKRFDKYLRNSIKKRYRSDVPVSLAFSGGLDSSSILIKSPKSYPIELYTFVSDKDNNDFQKLYFSNKKEPHNDFQLSIDLANKYKAKQTLIYEEKESFVNTLKKCIYALESGHTSTSIDCAYKVYEKVSENHRVILEGQGADELLCGYFNISSLIKIYSELIKGNFRSCFKLINSHRDYYNLKNSLLLFLRWIRHPIIGYLFAFFTKRNLIVKFKNIRRDYLPNKFHNNIKEPILRTILRYQRIGLTNLLQYGDSLSMDNSVETRNPYLDKELCKEIYTGSFENVISSNTGKFILRNVLKNQLPEKVLFNPSKKGFANSNFENFLNLNNDCLRIINNEKTFKRQIWNGNFLKKYINDLYNEDGSSKKKIKKHFNTLYRILSIELWFRTFID